MCTLNSNTQDVASRRNLLFYCSNASRNTSLFYCTVHKCRKLAESASPLIWNTFENVGTSQSHRLSHWVGQYNFPAQFKQRWACGDLYAFLHARIYKHARFGNRAIHTSSSLARFACFVPALLVHRPMTMAHSLRRRERLDYLVLLRFHTANACHELSDAL